MDTVFLKEKAYPWFKDVAVYLEQISIKDNKGKRQLPISSSPEIHDNSRDAWFPECTNFDLALIRFTFEKAAELARVLKYNVESEHWTKVLSEWPEFTIDNEEGLLFARGLHYHESHRHFSHLMAIHPLGLIDFSKGKNDQEIIKNSINNLEKYGSDWWTGYSFSWLANLKARAFDGEGAADALRIFAEAFCLKNSFHVNGDQSGKGYSKFQYRPFTLEGNFAFASGLQEMLIQSHTGIIRVFPAIPVTWKDVEFENLRTVGAFLVSAKMVKGNLTEVVIKSEKGGTLKLFNSFLNKTFRKGGELIQGSEIITFRLIPGEILELHGEI